MALWIIVRAWTVLVYDQSADVSHTVIMTNQPRTSMEWMDHAREMHRQGLSVLDQYAGADPRPAQECSAGGAIATAFFAAAQSATAIAEFMQGGRRG